jgi:hypothetical protein
MPTIIDGTAGITFPVTAGSASAVQASSGRVLQVVSANTQTTTSTGSTTFVATGLTASITPSSTSSKIFVIVAGGVIRINSTNQAYLTIYRSGTNIGDTNRGLSQLGGIGLNDYTLSLSAYDSPSTTSSITYTLYIRTSSSTIGYELDTVPCTITLMEIAA